MKFCCPKVVFFRKKIPREFTLLIPLGTSSCIFGKRENMFSVPKDTVRFFHFSKVDSFIRFYSFCTMRKLSSLFQTFKHFSPNRFLSPGFVDFPGEHSLICPFSASYQNRVLSHRQVLKLPREIY